MGATLRATAADWRNSLVALMIVFLSGLDLRILFNTRLARDDDAVGSREPPGGGVADASLRSWAVWEAVALVWGT